MKTKPHADMVDNVIAVWNRATVEQRIDGARWYADAHTRAKGLHHDLEVSAGVIAAVSPRMPWQKNLTLATKLINDYYNGLTLTGYLQNGLNIAQSILDGYDVLTVLTGQKRRAFFECIRAAGNTDMVCVDRHAMSVAYGCTVGDAEQGMTRKQYDAYANAYRDAARELGMPAAVLQATTWIVWRGSAS